MSSMKCRRLSMRATGLYLWLLCLMNEKPQQGRWALSTNEDHPTWKNSLTYRALQNACKRERLPMFATLLSRKFLPWKSGEVLKALQELYRFKLIVVEDDAIIQPRMYRDNGFKLHDDTMREYLQDDPADPSDDPEPELADTYKKDMESTAADSTLNGTQKGTLKGTQKVHEIHAGAYSNEPESENNNNLNSSSKGGAGESARTFAKTKKKNLKGTPVRDNPPSPEDIAAYFAERQQQNKPLLYITADEYYDICTASNWTRGKHGEPIYDWKAYLRQCDLWRQRHGDLPIAVRAQTVPREGDPVKAGPPADGQPKYRKW